MKVTNRWLVTLVLTGGILLSACGSPQQATPTPVPQKPAATSPAAPQISGDQQLADAAKKEGRIVLWAHTFQNKEGFLKSFKERYPFLDLQVWDSRSSELVIKVMEEAKAGRTTVDVVTLTDINIIDLRGLLLAYDWPSTNGWDKLYRPEHNLWRYYALDVRVPVYNRELISSAEAPKSLDDLKNPKWRGRSITSSSSEQLPLIYAYKWGEGGKLNWDKSFEFWRELYNNTRPRVMGGYEGAIGFVVAGEVSLHQMSALSTFFRYTWRGAPVALAPLPEVPATFYSVGIMKNAPHPNAAKLFADFFTSPEGQILFANGEGNPVPSPEAARKAKTNLALAESGIKTFMIPMDLFTPENAKKSQDFWNRLLVSG